MNKKLPNTPPPPKQKRMNETYCAKPISPECTNCSVITNRH